MLLITDHPDLDRMMDPTPGAPFLIPEDYGDTYTTVAPSNNTNNTLADDLNARDENLAKIEIAIQAIIFAFALFGNGFVLLALRYRKRKTSRMHVFIMHLSIADLLVAIFNILPQMAWDITFRFQGGDFSCRLIKYLQVMVIYLSTYVLVMTAVDRYRAICHPLSSYSWSSKKSHLMVGIAWIISILLSLPQLAIFRLQEVKPGSEVTDCWADFRPAWTVRLYVTTFSTTVFFLPSLILIVLYGRICFEVWRNVYHDLPTDANDLHPSGNHGNTSQGVSTGNGGKWPESGRVRYKFVGKGHMMVIPEKTPKKPQSGSGGRRVGSLLQGGRTHHHAASTISGAKMKTIKLTFVVIIAYMVCWAPFVTTQMWWAFDESAPYNNSTFVICLLLASLNSCCNPWIYMAFSESLVRQLIPCCRHRKPHAKPPVNPRERMRYPPSAPHKQPQQGVPDVKNPYQEDIPLQERIRMNDIRRKSTLLSRTASTKMTSPSTKITSLYRTDSRKSPQNNVIARYSREHGIIAAANLANCVPCATAYPQNDCSGSQHARTGTKVCQCKECKSAMSDKSGRRRGLLTAWKERAEERDNCKSNSKSNSNSGGAKKKTPVVPPASKEKDSKNKRLKLHSDNSHPFLSFKSFVDEGGEAEKLQLNALDNDIRLPAL